MLTQVLLLALTISDPTAVRPYGYYKPRVEVWTAKGDNPFFRGDGARVYLRADQDAYVTLFRVDTDGRVRVLFPRAPWEDNFVRGGQEFEVQNYPASYAFTVDDYPGVGYLFAVAAADPFVYDPIETGDHWDYRVIADGRVRGDPYVALTDLAGRIVPANDSDWDYDMVPYYVERHYDYPRFLCYDCHAYASWSYWDPYAYSCVRFRIVVFDDPYYYPYRYYGGTRVVFTRPLRPQPRFIFRDLTGANEGFLTRAGERPVNDNERRGVRGSDLGGRGVIPPPSRQRPPDSGRPGNDGHRDGDDGHGGGRRDRPDHPDHPDHPDRPDRPDHPDHPDRPDHPEHPDHPDRPDRPDHPERRDRPGRNDDQGRPNQTQRDDRPARSDRPSDVGRPQQSRPQPAEARPEPRRVDPPRAQPREAPRQAEPRRDAPPKEKPQSNGQPELRRRKP